MNTSHRRIEDLKMQFVVRAPGELVHAIDDNAKCLGISRNAYIQQLLYQALDQDPPPPLEQMKTRLKEELITYIDKKLKMTSRRRLPSGQQE